MLKRSLVLICSVIAVVMCSAPRGASQENPSDIRVIVNLVQLNVAVTDNK